MTSTGNDLDATAKLRGAGLRVTRPRLAVLDALDAQPHASVETIAARARRTLGSVSTQAIYDVLGALTAAELARRIEPAGSPAVYEARVGDNHHHLVCRSCGSVADVDCVVGEAPCLTPADNEAADHLGFVIDEAEVVFWGTCSACTNNPNSSNTQTTTALEARV
jgi:Fur family transcriptional regulator, stress-responsive regulator